MNLFGHLLPDNAILGIGPLMFEQHPNMEQQLAYGSARYFFDLHLAAHTTTIKSDWFQRRGTEEQEHETKLAMAKWKNEYFTLRKRVGNIICEDPDDYKFHIDQVSEAYEALKASLTSLFADLVPAPHNQEPVNERISKIYEGVGQLRDLACK